MRRVFIESTAESAATGEVADYYASQRAAWGFLPNYAACFASRPDVAAGWNQLNLALRTGSDRRRFEIATIAAARALRSSYCTAAHSKFLRDACHDEATMRSIAEDPTGAGLAEPDRSLYVFAAKVAEDASSVEQADIDHLRSVGLTDADIADAVFAVAGRAFFTTVLDGLGALMDPEIAAEFDPELRERMIVGRPPGS